MGEIEGTRMYQEDLKRSYGEKSKAALGFLIKSVPRTVLESFIIHPSDIKDSIPLTSIEEKDWPEDAKLTISKHPWLKEYGYLRDIKGNQVFKVMFGTRGQSIK